MPQIRAVAFDMDGLMLNTEEVYKEVGSRWLHRRGHEFTAEIMDLMTGIPAPRGFELVIEHLGLADTVEELIDESDREYLSIVGQMVRPMPGLMELLDALESADIPKAVATSSSLHLATASLTPFDLQRRFAFVLTSEDVCHGKPHPEIYLTTAARLGVPPSAMLVLEDSEQGCRAAAASGAFTVAVPATHSRKHDFSGAALVVDGLADPRLYAALGLPGSASEASAVS